MQSSLNLFLHFGKRSITFFLLFTLSILTFTNCKKKEPFSLAGSETMHEMILLLTNEFSKQNPDYLPDVRGGGSKLGIEALEAGITDIALVSRNLKPEEKVLLNAKKNLEEVVIAYDGAAIVVHPTNPISQIDLETASKIFSGQISNWKEVGGDDLPIKVIIRNKFSGTGLFFKEHVVQKKDLGEEAYTPEIDYSSNSIIVDDNIELVNRVSGDPASISYIGMGYAQNSKDKLKALSYAKRSTDEFIEPNIQNMVNRKYRLARGLYLVYKNQNKKSVDEFVSFATGEKGQKLILKSGYLRSTLEEVEVKAK